MAGSFTSQASALQTSFSQIDENLVHIAEDSESKLHYHLRKKIRLSENIKEIFNESEIEMQVPEDTDDIDPEDTDDIDSEDLQGASLDNVLDTIEGKNVPKRIAEWPNVAYRDFLKLIVKSNILNKMGDKIINFFNKHSNLEKSPLPSSTKKDATTFDGLDKTSGHPVFLTFGNLSNLVQNLPEAKILLGFLPKIQDTGIRNMLEADDVTATYKGAKCKMPCHSCMVLQSDLNNMSLELEDMAPRTHKNM
ncbi:hypothetical protein C1646_760786 [Rhizophagus diaphanus]|nr:hypothetical protein C1646_760786 [Rhizophagus diaphanus] [Rhizophagus sp. MUCL 43196]